MATQPLKADKLLIGKQSNVIERSPEGDMIFRDSFITTGVTLTQLLGGASFLSPAIVVTVEEADWTETTISGQIMYSVEVPHPWDDLCEPKIEVNFWNTDNEEITFNKVTFNNTSILLQSTVKIDVKVVLKRI